MHAGSLLTALASYLDAHRQGGTWHLRIDDLDTPRVKTGAVDDIFRQLERLGLIWDGPVHHQQGRHERYSEGVRALGGLGLLYACDCARRERRTPKGNLSLGCPGKCFERKVEFVAGKTALRIRVPDRILEMEDRVKGFHTQRIALETGDFVIYRKDKIHAYPLATVLDDEDMGITHIVRGEDLIEATPAQNFLRNVLSLTIPSYAHTPLMVDNSGCKLSKSAPLEEINRRSPAQMLSYLLTCLRHPPPDELRGARTPEQLAWATEHWEMDRLKGIGSILTETQMET